MPCPPVNFNLSLVRDESHSSSASYRRRLLALLHLDLATLYKLIFAICTSFEIGENCRLCNIRRVLFRVVFGGQVQLSCVSTVASWPVRDNKYIVAISTRHVCGGRMAKSRLDVRNCFSRIFLWASGRMRIINLTTRYEHFSVLLWRNESSVY